MDDFVGTRAPIEQKTKRTRNKAPKSRQGCARCKARRIRCDENHPACQNCIKFGRPCPGFQQKLRWSKKHERLQRSSTSGHQPNDAIAPSTGDQASDLGHTENLPSGPNASASVLSPLAGLDWLATLPTTSRDSGIDLDNSGSTTATPTLEILQTPYHLPNMLIEHRFRYICPLWSTYDSGISYSRQLAWGSWSTSKAVFYTMQAMSAACLSVTTPHFRTDMSSLKLQAVAAIDEAVHLARSSQSPMITPDLLYAVFTFANSLHCMTPTRSKKYWVESARGLLCIWSTQVPVPDSPLYAYFSQALNYWDMLLGAVGCGSVPSKLARKRRNYHVKLRQAMHLPTHCGDSLLSDPDPDHPGQNLLGTRPNSWSGISHEIIDIFGQVLALCHNSCSTTVLTTTSASDALCELSLAHDLKRELQGIDIETLVFMEEMQGFSLQTGDDNTPIAHLLQTAEAYRLAALLQLYLAFSDLEITPQDTTFLSNTRTNCVAQNRPQNILSLALELVTTLEQFPAQSGSRSIHLMLYLSAAAGLKFETLSNDANSEPEAANLSSDFIWGSVTLESDMTSLIFPEMTDDNYTNDPTNNTLSLVIPPSNLEEVSRARHFIFTRLGGLQHTLQHRKIENTLSFLKAIWEEYDCLHSPYRSMAHWLDIMTEKGLSITLW